MNTKYVALKLLVALIGYLFVLNKVAIAGETKLRCSITGSKYTNFNGQTEKKDFKKSGLTMLIKDYGLNFDIEFIGDDEETTASVGTLGNDKVINSSNRTQYNIDAYDTRIKEIGGKKAIYKYHTVAKVDRQTGVINVFSSWTLEGLKLEKVADYSGTCKVVSNTNKF